MTNNTQVFADDQPSGFVNQIRNVAIIGAGGQVGKFVVAELQKNKQFTITALTRAGSTNKLPQGIRSTEVSYDDHGSLVSALKGQDVLIATLPAQSSDPELQNKIVDAVKEAGVRFFLPNEWGYDSPSEEYDQQNIVGGRKRAERAYIEKKGVTWIGIGNGFWYEYSLSGGIPFFGVDSMNRKALLFDQGSQAISTSTWEQVGRGVAALLALPIYPSKNDNSDNKPTVGSYSNKFVRIQSFNITQRQMIQSVQRVTNTTDADWTIENRPVKEVWQEGFDKLKSGDFSGFIVALYSRAFFPDGGADYVKRGVLDNDKLGLPVEDLDEATARAIELQKDNYIGKLFAH
jgi:hypothetical protein